MIPNTLLITLNLFLFSITTVFSTQIPFHVDNGAFKFANGKDFGFITGANVGATVPGSDPGTLSPGKDVYLRQFKYCRDMHINVIRIYTLLSADFYEAFHEWNSLQTNDYNKLYLIQGIWSPVDELANDNQGADAYDPEIYDKMKDYIDRTVKGVHGGGLIANDAGVDDYTVSVASWVLAYMVGTEWDPNGVYKTMTGSHQGKVFNGTFVQTLPRAHAFETWLAEMLEYVAEIDMQFGYQHPLAFTNWITTDAIRAPMETEFNISDPKLKGASREDWMSVNANHIGSTSKWQAGYYFNQHSYPYYPNFLKFNLTQHGVPGDLLETTDYMEDSYLNYLARLRKVFKGQAMILSETGLSTSLGYASSAQAGRKNGNMDEVTQGKLVAQIIKDVAAMGWNGILVFQLVDEWFKKSWNTQNIDWDRRSWHNALNAEQYFGLIGVESIKPVVIDGKKDSNSDNWLTSVQHTDSESFGMVQVAHDETYLYLSIEKADGNTWNSSDIFFVGFDTVPNEGAYVISNNENNEDLVTSKGAAINFQRAMDYMLMYNGTNGDTQMFSNIVTDPFYHFYWPNVMNDGSGIRDMGYTSDQGIFWVMQQLIAADFSIPSNFSYLCKNDPITTDADGVKQGCKKVCQETGYDNETGCVLLPGVNYTLGNMIRGSSNYENSATYNSLSTWEVDGSIYETRIPWAMIGISDPSTKRVGLPQGKTYQLKESKTNIKAQVASVLIDNINIEVVYNGYPEENNMMDIGVSTVIEYSWDDWEEIYYLERYKKSVPYIADVFKAVRNGENMKKYVYDPNTAQSFPSSPLFVKTASAPKFVFYSWLFVACSIYQIVMFFILGFVFPIIPIFLYCYGGKKLRSKHQGSGNLNMCAGVFFILVVVGFGLAYFLEDLAPHDVFENALNNMQNGSDSSSLFGSTSFWIWFAALQLDAFIMALFVLFARFPKNHNQKRIKKENKREQKEAKKLLKKLSKNPNQNQNESIDDRNDNAEINNTQEDIIMGNDEHMDPVDHAVAAGNFHLRTNFDNLKKELSPCSAPSLQLFRKPSFADSNPYFHDKNNTNPMLTSQKEEIELKRIHIRKTLQRNMSQRRASQRAGITRRKSCMAGPSENIKYYDDIEDTTPIPMPSDLMTRNSNLKARDSEGNNNDINDVNDSVGEIVPPATTLDTNIDMGPAMTDRHCFIISCHNSSLKISATLEAALINNEPWQIYVADNGSSEYERTETRRLCLLYSLEYKEDRPDYDGGHINYSYIKEGSKTVAQFSSVQHVLKNDRRIQYVTFIDDDTIIPTKWIEEDIIYYFQKDKHLQCLAYALHSTSTDSTLALFENYEYLIVGVNKIFQSQMGTTIFASGAYNTWRIPVIGDILARHNTMHNGDDLQQGLLLHQNGGRKFKLNPEQRHIKSPTVKVCHVVISTDVPICWMHSKDFIPNAILRKWRPKECSCGEPSMLAQRGYGWDVSRHRFFLNFLQMIFCRPTMSKNFFLVRLFALYEAIQIPYDWFVLFYGYGFLIYSIFFSGKYLFFISTFIIAWSIQSIVGFLLNIFVLHPAKLSVSYEVIFFYPMLYKFYTITVIRAVGMLYNTLYYFPCVRNKKVIYKRLNDPNDDLAVNLEVAFQGNPEDDRIFIDEWEKLKDDTLETLLKTMASEARRNNFTKMQRAPSNKSLSCYSSNVALISRSDRSNDSTTSSNNSNRTQSNTSSNSSSSGSNGRLAPF